MALSLAMTDDDFLSAFEACNARARLAQHYSAAALDSPAARAAFVAPGLAPFPAIRDKAH
jgi:hypothetical protein